MASIGAHNLEEFIRLLSIKQPTPGGGAAAAVGAAIGAAAARMSAAYTMRKKDIDSGAAVKAEALINDLNMQTALLAADADAAAYADLQRSWKDGSMSPEEKASIEAKALQVPISLVETCLKYINAIHDFLPACNPNITSDAKVGIHMLAGAARAAYQTALVNSPPEDERQRLKAMLRGMQNVEDKILGLTD